MKTFWKGTSSMSIFEATWASGGLVWSLLLLSLLPSMSGVPGIQNVAWAALGLYCVAFSKAMESERQKAVIGSCHVLTERQIYSLLLFTWRFSRQCGFDVRFVWQLVNTPGRLEFISTKWTGMKGREMRDAVRIQSRAETTLPLQTLGVSRPLRTPQVKEAFPASAVPTRSECRFPTLGMPWSSVNWVTVWASVAKWGWQDDTDLPGGTHEFTLIKTLKQHQAPCKLGQDPFLLFMMLLLLLPEHGMGRGHLKRTEYRLCSQNTWVKVPTPPLTGWKIWRKLSLGGPNYKG